MRRIHRASSPARHREAPAQHDIARHIDGFVLRLRIGRGLPNRHAVLEDREHFIRRQFTVIHRDLVDAAEILLAAVRTRLPADHKRPIVRIDVYLPGGLALAFHLTVHVHAKRFVAERTDNEVPFIVDDHGRPIHERCGVVDEELESWETDILSQDQIETTRLPLGFVDHAGPVWDRRGLDPGQQANLGRHIILGDLGDRDARATDELQRRARLACAPDGVADDSARVVVAGNVLGRGAAAFVERQVQDQGFVDRPGLRAHQQT